MSAPTQPLTLDVPPRPPSPPRRGGAVRAVTAAVAAVLVAGGALSVLGSMTAVREQRTDTFPGPVTAVVVSTGTGDVQVAAGGGDGARVTTTTVSGWSQADARADLRDGVLDLRGACSHGGWPGRCSTDFDVVVPAGVRVSLDTGTGDQRLTGAFGAVVSEAGTGSVRWSGADGGRLDIEAGTGSVTVTGALDDVRVDAGTGDVRLELDAAPGSVDVRTSTGDADVLVPDDGTAYAAEVSAGTGGERVDVPVDPSADRRVLVSTGTGDARLSHR
ncbi:DUF4097 family beta strand repeat-containing protein [Kineococcus terrestris]|uniref:DUF4097 family beta strand repeat-containing protein n=1 Tax=Kineococcus terrestris TaxID=2044856 RepID=UPI0034DB1C59